MELDRRLGRALHQSGLCKGSRESHGRLSGRRCIRDRGGGIHIESLREVLQVEEIDVLEFLVAALYPLLFE